MLGFNLFQFEVHHTDDWMINVMQIDTTYWAGSLLRVGYIRFNSFSQWDVDILYTQELLDIIQDKIEEKRGR